MAINKSANSNCCLPKRLNNVTGFAGAELKKLHRITGLDPAGPLFEGAHVAARLDESDAEFVGN